MNEQNSEHPDTAHVPSPPGVGTDLVKVRYWSETKNDFVSATAYTYRSEDRLAVGDLVKVPVKDRDMKAKVIQVDVPEAEIQSFITSVRTIPSGSRIVQPTDQEKVAEITEEMVSKVKPLGPAEDIVGTIEDEEPTGAAILGDGSDLLSSEELWEGIPSANPANEEPAVVSPVEDNLHQTEPEPEMPEAHPEQFASQLAVLDPPIVPGIVSLISQSQRLLALAKDVIIIDNEGLVGATNDLSILAGIKKRMESIRKLVVDPIRQELDQKNSVFKDITSPILEADNLLRTAVSKYHLKVAEERQEADRKRVKAEETNRMAEEVARRQAAESGTGEIEVDLTPVEAPPPPPPAPKSVKSDLGSVTMKDNWHYRVVDFAALPDAYKVEASALLNTHAKSYKDTKPVEGVEFFNLPVPAVRSRA